MGSIVEIERKYIARVVGVIADPDEIIYSTQSYVVSAKFWEWRIRHFETLRSHRPTRPGGVWYSAMKFGNGHRRYEFETAVPNWLGRALAYIASEPLHKIRTLVNGWDIDQFIKPSHIEGLCLAEYETDSIHDPSPAPPKQLILLEEVTGRKQWANKNLVNRTDQELRDTIKRCSP